jgi:hypothetical protein
MTNQGHRSPVAFRHPETGDVSSHRLKVIGFDRTGRVAAAITAQVDRHHFARSRRDRPHLVPPCGPAFGNTLNEDYHPSLFCDCCAAVATVGGSGAKRRLHYQ